MSPKVFVSHASEDKDRFVNKFAIKLRENGVDAWLDQWEMLPGDSLVDKIFEEGLKEAEAIIIVLSNFSVSKPWVREELNASIVSKLSKGTKIIPVVLDDCNVPESLTSTLWESIGNLEDYETSFKRVLSSIFGLTDKPSLGSAPAHATSKYYEIGGLTKADNLILKISCDQAIEAGDIFINPESLFSNGNDFGFSRAEIKDCIEVLEENGYLDVTRFLGGGDNYGCHYKVTTYGFDKYANAYVSDYASIVEGVVSAIVNEKMTSNAELQEKIRGEVIVINYILDVLEANGYIKLSKLIGGGIQIHHVAASLRRALA